MCFRYTMPEYDFELGYHSIAVSKGMKSQLPVPVEWSAQALDRLDNLDILAYSSDKCKKIGDGYAHSNTGSRTLVFRRLSIPNGLLKMDVFPLHHIRVP